MSRENLTRWAGWGLRIAAAAAVVWLAARSAPFGDVASHLRIEYLWAFLAAQPAYVVSVYVLGWRHARLVGAPANKGFRAVLLASGMNYLFPARMAEVLKATYLKEHCGIPVSKALAAVIWERLLDLICLGCLALFALGSRAADFPVFFLLVFAAAVLFFLMPLVVRRSRGLTDLLPHPRLRAFAGHMLTNVAQFAASRTRWLTMTLTLLAWSGSVTSAYVLINVAADHAVPLADTIAIFTISTLGLAVPLLPGGLGTFEAAAVVALRMYGFDGTTALTLALLFRLHQMTFIVGGALYILMTEHLGVVSLYHRLRDALNKPVEPAG